MSEELLKRLIQKALDGGYYEVIDGESISKFDPLASSILYDVYQPDSLELFKKYTFILSLVRTCKEIDVTYHRETALGIKKSLQDICLEDLVFRFLDNEKSNSQPENDLTNDKDVLCKHEK